MAASAPPRARPRPTHHRDRAARFLRDGERVDVVDVVAEPADGAVVDLADVALDLTVEFPAATKCRGHDRGLGCRAPVHSARDHAQRLVMDQPDLLALALDRLAHRLLPRHRARVQIEQDRRVDGFHPVAVLEKCLGVAEGTAPHKL